MTSLCVCLQVGLHFCVLKDRLFLASAGYREFRDESTSCPHPTPHLPSETSEQLKEVKDRIVSTHSVQGDVCYEACLIE